METEARPTQLVFRTSHTVREALEEIAASERRTISNVIHCLVLEALEARNEVAHPAPRSRNLGKGKRR